MKLHRWNEIPVEQLNTSVTRQVLHGESLTVARLSLREGAIVPRHSHPNEQISTIESGVLRFFFDDRDVIARSGESVQIPSGIPHGVEAMEDSVAIDVFSPVREDWIRGDDAYLRNG
jgi:quercetin dioxygenase-like cupin family protein